MLLKWDRDSTVLLKASISVFKETFEYKQTGDIYIHCVRTMLH
jgi:hypothetical protein